jgi:hypothetical protein
MHWLPRLFRKEQSEKQLNDELRFDMERQVSSDIAAGMTPAEARRHAQLERKWHRRVMCAVLCELYPSFSWSDKSVFVLPLRGPHFSTYEP